MKKYAILGLIMLLTAVPAISSADITQSDRLLQRPEWDGAVMTASLIDGGVTYEDWEDDGFDFTVWSLGGVFITSLPGVPNLELGGRLDFMNYDPDTGDSESGLSDIDLWGKYQLYRDAQMMISAGLLLTLPTGSDDILHPHASGEFNAEVFGAGRYQASRFLAIIGHLMLRQNDDMDFKIGSTEITFDGETQWGFGGGVIYEVNPQVNLQGELNFATEPYDNWEDDIQLRGGVEFNLSPAFTFKTGLSLGLDDGAPDWALTVRGAYLF